MSCIIINKIVRELANQLGKAPAETASMIGVYQEENNTYDYPSIELLKSITSSKKVNTYAIEYKDSTENDVEILPSSIIMNSKLKTVIGALEYLDEFINVSREIDDSNLSAEDLKVYNAAVAELEKLFNKSADFINQNNLDEGSLGMFLATLHSNFDGMYLLEEDIDAAINATKAYMNFYKKENGSTNSLYVKDLFLNRQSITVGEALDSISKTPNYGLLATSFKQYINSLNNISIQLREMAIKDAADSGEAYGYYDKNSNTIFLNRSKLDKITTPTIMHEIVHAVVYNAKPLFNAELINLWQLARLMVEYKYGKSVDVLAKENPLRFYGFVNPDEYCSELFTAPLFIEELNSLGEKEDVSLLDLLCNFLWSFINKWFGIQNTGTSKLFNRSVQTLKNLIMNSNGTVSREQRASLNLAVTSMKNIEDITSKNGTLMKAPDGTLSSLSRDLWLYLRTPEFINYTGLDWTKTNDITSNLLKAMVDHPTLDFVLEAWKGDKNKQSIAIYPKDNHNKGSFVLVKDNELNYYSVHFKTGNADTKEMYGTSKEERNEMFKALFDLIPASARVSTWGNISEGGIKALDKLMTATSVKSNVVEEREILDRQGNTIKINVYAKPGVALDSNGEPALFQNTVWVYSDNRKANAISLFSSEYTTKPMLDTIRTLEGVASLNRKDVRFYDVYKNGDTEYNHVYTINGNIVDLTTTGLFEKPQHSYKEGDPATYFEVSTSIGSAHDEVGRVFFDRSATLADSYKNMNPRQVSAFTIELGKLKLELDAKFLGNYKVYTNEDFLRVFGNVAKDNTIKSIAGTIDMLVVDGEGYLHIYDFKTKRYTDKNKGEFSNDDLDKYSNQLSVYKELLELRHPNLKGKVKSLNLIKFNVLYATPAANKLGVGSVNYVMRDKQVYVKTNDGKEIPLQDYINTNADVYSSGKFAGITTLDYKKPIAKDLNGKVSDIQLMAFSRKSDVPQYKNIPSADLANLANNKGLNNWMQLLALLNKAAENASKMELPYMPDELLAALALEEERRKLQSSNTSTNANDPYLGITIATAEKFFTREEAEDNPDTLYVFTDNTDRTSGNNPINKNSAYYKKYGNGTDDLYFPNKRQAVLRGMDNAMPISTQRHYVNILESLKGNWTDDDVLEFERIIDEELTDIENALKSGKYKRAVFGSLFNGSISRITPARANAVKITDALCRQLAKHNLSTLIPNGFNQIKLEELPKETSLEVTPSTITINSGGAYGADYYWDSIGQSYGIPSTSFNHYTGSLVGVKHNVNAKVLTNELLEKVKAILEPMARLSLDVNKPEALTILRDYYLAQNSDHVFAIAELNEDTFGNKIAVNGGTRFAVGVARMQNKPINVFNLKDNKWYEFDYTSNTFKECDVPVLSAKSACIGSRSLEDYKNAKKYNAEYLKAGIKAIHEVYAKTFNVLTPELKAAENESKRDEMNEEVNTDILEFHQAFPTLILNYRLALITNMFSNEVDNALALYLEDKAQGKIDFNEGSAELITENSFEGYKERRVAALYVGLNTIVSNIKNEFMQMLNDTDDEYEKQQYANIIKHFNYLFNSASFRIEEKEKMIISLKDKRIEESKLTAEESDLDAIEDGLDKQAVSGNSGWSFKVRNVDPHSSISKATKEILRGIYDVDASTGDIKMDDLGNPLFINEIYAHTVLLSELCVMGDDSEFAYESKEEPGKYVFPILEGLRTKYAWIDNVIDNLLYDRLKISAFYADMRKDFIPYYKTYTNQDGKTVTLALNVEAASELAVNTLQHNYETGNILTEKSIYNNKRELSPENAKYWLGQIKKINTNTILDSEEEMNSLLEILKDALQSIGFPVDTDLLKFILNTKVAAEDDTPLSLGKDKIKDISKRLKYIFNTIIKDKGLGHLVSQNSSNIRKIAKIIGEVAETANMGSFRNNDKSYYSYSAPNYATTLFKILSRNSDNEYDENGNLIKKGRRQFIEENFKKFDWFYKDGKWRNTYLKMLDSEADTNFKSDEIAANLDIRELLDIDGKPYELWESGDILKGFLQLYLAGGENYGYYNLPIFSDSPIVMFVKAPKFTGINYQLQILLELKENVYLELDRINLCKNEREGAMEISQFDGKRGKQFCFFPFLNLDTDFLSKITAAKLSYSTGELTAEEAKSLMDETIITALLNYYTKECDKFVKDNIESYKTLAALNLVDPTKNKLKYLEDPAYREWYDTTLEENYLERGRILESYYWNHALATLNLILLTTTDLAFYKDGTDFLKRYKEVYAAGTKLNTLSEYGKANENTIYLTDDVIVSNNYQSFIETLDKAEKEGRIFDKSVILSKFKDITATDALAFRSLKSYRSVLDMMGLWNEKMANCLDRIRNGVWDLNDFDVVWQTIKPFLYTLIAKPKYSQLYLDSKLTDAEFIEQCRLEGIDPQSKIEEMSKQQIKVPHQNKNSEFLLLPLYTMMINSSAKSNTLNALELFMEENDIDVIQFESAVKAGKLGCININYSDKKALLFVSDWGLYGLKIFDLHTKVMKPNKAEKASYAEKLIAGALYLLDNPNEFILEEGDTPFTQEVYNTLINSIRPSASELNETLSKYVFKDGKTKDSGYNEEVVHLLPYSDYNIALPTPEHLYDTDAVFGSLLRNLIVSDFDDNTTLNINGKEYNKEEVLTLYDNLIVQNLLEDYDNLVNTKFKDIESFLKAVLTLIEGNPKYGRNILDALLLVEDPNTGNKKFNLSILNPSILGQLEEICTSMFKNAVTKLKIKGASCILVSDFGHSDKLLVKKKEDGGYIVQCMMPWHTKKYFTPFLKEKQVTVETIDNLGNKTLTTNSIKELDIELIKKEAPELLLAIGYRIPTEDKYSMASLEIVGFLPQLNGGCIMLPADITQIAGSDFDVDKMFLMLYEYQSWKELNLKNAWASFAADFTIQKDNEETTLSAAYHDDVYQIIDIIDTLILKNYDLVGLSQNAEANEDAIINNVLTPIYSKWNSKLSEEDKTNIINAFGKFLLKSHNKFRDGANHIRKILYDSDKLPDSNNRKQRNNMLIDICRAIMEHPNTADKFINPGSFDRAKKEARITLIMLDSNLFNAFYLSKTGRPFEEELDFDKAILLLNKESLGDLNSFLASTKQELDPLSLSTFLFYHLQNAIGGLLIGVYANNTNLRAKFQNANLYIRPTLLYDRTAKDKSNPYKVIDNAIKVDGKILTSLSSVLSAWGERISKNCAEFSNSSVDNVKDPILAWLKQNPNTARYTNTMLALGFPISLISDMFLITDIVPLEGSPKEMAEWELSIKDAYFTDSKDVVNGNEVTLKTSVSENMDVIKETRLVSRYVSQLCGKNKKEYGLNLLDIHALWELIKLLSADLSLIDAVSKADSPNNAISTKFSEGMSRLVTTRNAYIRTFGRYYKIGNASELLEPLCEDLTNLSTEDLAKYFMKAPCRRLAAFHQLGVKLPFEIMSRFFPQIKHEMRALGLSLNTLGENCALYNNTEEEFFKDIVEFSLTQSPFYTKKTKDYYLNKFPAEYLNIILNNPELKQYKILDSIYHNVEDVTVKEFGTTRVVTVSNGLLMRNSTRVTPTVLDMYINDLDNMISSENPVVRDLARDLFMYSMFKDNLTFKPGSFGRFFSPTFLNRFKHITSAIESLESNIDNALFLQNYVTQFFLQHKDSLLFNLEIIEYGRVVDIPVIEGKMKVNYKYVRNRTTQKPHYLLLHNGKLFKFESTNNNSNDKVCTYVEIPIQEFEGYDAKQSYNQIRDLVFTAIEEVSDLLNNIDTIYTNTVVADSIKKLNYSLDDYFKSEKCKLDAINKNGAEQRLCAI